MVRRHGHARAATQRAFVIDRPRGGNGKGLLRRQRSRGVGRIAGQRSSQAATRLDGPAIIGDGLRRQRHVARLVEDLPARIIQRAHDGNRGQPGRARYLATGIGQRAAAGERQARLCRNRTGIGNGPCPGGQAAAGCANTAAIADRSGPGRQRRAGTDAAAIFKDAASRQLHPATRLQRSAIGDLPPHLGLYITRGGHGAIQHKVASIGERHVPGIRRHGAVHPHAGAGLVDHHVDPVGVHPAKGRRIDREFRCGRAVGRQRMGRVGAVIDPVAPGHDIGRLRIDLRLQGHRTRQDVEHRHGSEVTALTFKSDVAAPDRDVLQVPRRIHLRRAGGQRHPGGVDEPAAGTGNAVGVGHHHRGLVPRHFRIAQHQGRQVAGHLVENQAGGMVMQVLVAIDHATDLRFGGRGGVVQDHAAFGHAIFEKVVMRHARRIRGGDIDLIDTVLGLVQRGFRATGMGIDHDLRLGLLRRGHGNRRGQKQGGRCKHMHAALEKGRTRNGIGRGSPAARLHQIFAPT
ncbi:hypothetical protein MSKU15_0168 [Komagataeibacter diospyri]|nr:hypothetical protein MSKU15_0168 [Komagataeibacter diospyri]